MLPVSSILRILLVTVALAAAQAYPYYFMEKGFSQGNCSAVPEKNYERHGAPQNDSNIAISVTSAKAASVSVCPGATYDLSVTFPIRMLYMITVPQGYGLSTTFDKTCLNRDASPRISTVSSVSNVITVPCSATGPLVVNVRAAASQFDFYRSASLSLPVNGSCALASCAAAAPPASKPPPRKASRPPPKAKASKPPPRPKASNKPPPKASNKPPPKA